MSLSDRLSAANALTVPTEIAVEAPAAQVSGGTPAASAPPAPTVRQQQPALDGVKARAIDALFVRLGARITDSALTDAQLREFVREELGSIISAEQVLLSTEERRRLIQDIEDDALGLGPLQRLLDDRTVSEIMVNCYDKIYVERAGRLSESGMRFGSEEHLRQVIDRIVANVGRRIDESSPLVDARLSDGSRVNAIIPPLAVNGSSLTIRKFSATPYQANDLVNFGTISDNISDFLHACVEGRLNILVSGGTGTGKTTLLNVLSSFIPHDERIVTIEDAVELELMQEHVVTLESRPPNIERTGEITIRDLVRNSLRMRPDRIIIGEVRGGESLDMLQAMNTGHDGSISTVHANSPRDATSRLETLVLMAGMDLPLRAIREQVASAIDLIIQLTRMRDGSRRVTAVTEVLGMENDTVVLQEIFAFDYSAGVDPDGRFRGTQVATGIRPRFMDKFDDRGIAYTNELFTPPAGGFKR